MSAATWTAIDGVGGGHASFAAWFEYGSFVPLAIDGSNLVKP